MAERDVLDLLAESGSYPYLDSHDNLYLNPRMPLLSADSLEMIREELIARFPSLSEARLEIRRRREELKENKPIRQWVKEERPRELLMAKGAPALPLAKLLAILLSTGRDGVSAEELAQQLLTRYGSLRALDDVPLRELCKIRGIGLAKAAQIQAAFELGNRLSSERVTPAMRIKSPQDAARYVAGWFAPHLRDARKESFHVIFLNGKNQPIDRKQLSEGTINASLVDPGEVIREASQRSALSLILVHNHPSGDPQPSPEDISLTRSLAQACQLVGIKVLDHIVVGKNEEDIFTFKENGLL
ncbi:MAG: DNA repair protein RadC [Coprothermobacterota bacterium]|nr:DNA repair protein RadC [Coprothermobacterota bacterium]